MSNLTEMKTLDINGNKFECVDGYAREQIEVLKPRPAHIDVKVKDFKKGLKNDYSIEVGSYVAVEDRTEEKESMNPDEGYMLAVVNVKKGDVITRIDQNTHFEIANVFNEDGYLIQHLGYTDLDYSSGRGKMVVEQDGVLYLDFTYFSSATDEDIAFTIDTAESSQQPSLQLPGYELIPVTENDVLKGSIRPLSDAPIYVGSNMFKEQAPISYPSSGEYASQFCTFDCKINEGDMIIFTHLSNMYDRLEGYPLVVVSDSGIITEVIDPNEVRFNKAYMFYIQDEGRIAGAYKFKTSGTLYMTFVYTDVYFAEYFYIKRTHPTEPFVLNTLLSAEYDSGVYPEPDVYPDNYFGDEALKAIMEGRQILVRILNQGSEQTPHTALYSPIYQYQLPNYRNGYLYLFYLEDYKQTIDLSAMGLGQIEIPVYGQLKLKVSREYHQSPLI